jgi:hypothetical protein
MNANKANQVATFEKLLGFCNEQKTVYNPSKASIQVAALNTLLTQSQNQLKAADVSRIAYENAVNARQTAFSTLQKKASRIMNALVASGASAETLADARAIRRKLKPQPKVLVSPPTRTASADVPVQEEKVYRSVSQLDKASLVQNFEMLVSRVSAEPLYKPNESDLTIAGLTTYATQLRTLNKNVISAYEAMRTATRNLNLILYGANGICSTGRAAKAYIRSVYGHGSTEHKAITMFQFKKG